MLPTKSRVADRNVSQMTESKSEGPGTERNVEMVVVWRSKERIECYSNENERELELAKLELESQQKRE